MFPFTFVAPIVVVDILLMTTLKKEKKEKRIERKEKGKQKDLKGNGANVCGRAFLLACFLQSFLPFFSQTKHLPLHFGYTTPLGFKS